MVPADSKLFTGVRPGPSTRQRLKLSVGNSRLSRSRNAPPREEVRELPENHDRLCPVDLNRRITLGNHIVIEGGGVPEEAHEHIAGAGTGQII
jgi:hypothetical protein